MVGQHHERYGGHGYLKGLRGEQVGLFGQIATVVDVYDAITSDRVYRRGILPHEALKRMFEWSPRDFDRRSAGEVHQSVSESTRSAAWWRSTIRKWGW